MEGLTSFSSADVFASNKRQVMSVSEIYKRDMKNKAQESFQGNDACRLSGIPGHSSRGCVRTHARAHSHKIYH